MLVALPRLVAVGDDMKLHVCASAILGALQVGCGFSSESGADDGQELIAQEPSTSEETAVLETGDDLTAISLTLASKRLLIGRALFAKATFGGNGRTCLTCHPFDTGTISPAQVQARFIANPNDPLFRSIDSDDGVGSNYSRLLTHATIRAGVDLPPWARLTDDPSATSVVLNRGIPSMINRGAPGMVLMHDGRAPSLEVQANGAIHGHYQPTIEPTSDQLSLIADFERSLYSSAAIARYARGEVLILPLPFPEPIKPVEETLSVQISDAEPILEPEPEPVLVRVPPPLPAGTTDQEIRGRALFDRMCFTCHGGPMLDTTTAGDPFAFGGVIGIHFANIFVSERNLMQNPVKSYTFTNPDGTTTVRTTPDLGLALITNHHPQGDQFGAPVNFFRIPSLWDVQRTAPYFHDNSAKTLEEVMAHYAFYLFDRLENTPLTPEKQADIIAFMKLL